MSEDHLCTLFFIEMSKERLGKSKRTPPVLWRPWALAYSRDRPYNFSCLSALSKNCRLRSFFSALGCHLARESLSWPAMSVSDKKQEKVRCLPNGFVRNGNEREREREREGGGGGVGSRETSSKTNRLEGPHWIKDTDVLTYLRLRDWRPRERTHCPGHRCFEDSPLVSWARVVWRLARWWTQLLWRAMDTSELPRQGANLSADHVDSSSSVTPASPPVPTLRLCASERGWKCQRNNMNKPAHVSR